MKYIIELNPDCVDGEFLRMPIRLAGEDQWIKTKALLTPYTEPDRKAIEDEVWEFARKMISTSGNEVSEMWGCATNFGEVMHNTTYSEAKSKFEAWLKQKDEIGVGDEIYSDGDYEKSVVMEINGDGCVSVYTKNGCIEHWWNKMHNLKKTGRHFPEVVELLEKMRGEEE